MGTLTDEKTLSGAPWWAKIAAIFGAPTLVLLVVLYGVWTLMTQIGLRMATAIETNQLTLIKLGVEFSGLRAEQSQLVDVVRANCYNNARDEASKERCMK